MVSSRRLLHCSSRSPGLKTSPAEEDEQQPALSYRTTSMGLCSALSFRASAASQPPARRREWAGPAPPRPIESERPRPRRCGPSLTPVADWGGVAAEGAWLRAGGGSWGCQSAPAAAAARTPGLRSRLSPAQVRPPRCSAIASLGTAVRVLRSCQRRAAQGAGPRPPLPHGAPPTLPARTVAGMRGGGASVSHLSPRCAGGPLPETRRNPGPGKFVDIRASRGAGG